jgi:hypothetical protein
MFTMASMMGIIVMTASMAILVNESNMEQLARLQVIIMSRIAMSNALSWVLATQFF